MDGEGAAEAGVLGEDHDVVPGRFPVPIGVEAVDGFCWPSVGVGKHILFA